MNGGNLTLQGDLIHSGGTLDVNGGTLVVEGDYRIQNVTLDGASSGMLNMTHTNDYILVKGDFVMASSQWSGSYLSAGILEVWGDFTQKHSVDSSWASENFKASGTHQVILSGTSQQTVHFESPGLWGSRFNILEIMNDSLDGVVFETPLNVSELRSHAHELNSITVQTMDWNLYEDIIINGELALKGNTLNLNGYQLTVHSNLIHSGGTLDVNGGTLTLQGDLIHSDGTLDLNGGTIGGRG